MLVTSSKGPRRSSSDYVFVDWGPDFRAEHAAAYPKMSATSLNLDLGSFGLHYLLSNEASGYFPARIVKPYVKRGRLRQPARARKFIYPVYVVYPEARDEDAYEPILEGLRSAAHRLG